MDDKFREQQNPNPVASQYSQTGFAQNMSQPQNPVVQEPNNFGAQAVQQPPQANKPAGFFKRHKVPIIIGAAVIVVAVVAAIILIPKGNSSGNGYVAQSGQELKINEKADKFGVTLLSDLEKFSNKKGEYLRVKARIKNYDDDTLSFTLSPFSLVDASYSGIYRFFTSIGASDEPEQLITSVGSGETAEGYLYFYSEVSSSEGKYVTDYTKKEEVEYLRAHIMSGATDLGDGNYGISYSDYYLPIK